MTSPNDPPAAPPRPLSHSPAVQQRPGLSNPVDPARLPVLTEVLLLEPAAVPLHVPVLTQTLPVLSAQVAALPETAVSAQLAAASLAYLPSSTPKSHATGALLGTATGATPTAAAPASAASAAAAIAAVAAQPSLPAASPADLARPLPPPGSIPLLPPWVHKVVTDAIDEAIAQAMPQLLSDITGHVRQRLTEASRNPNRNLF